MMVSALIYLILVACQPSAYLLIQLLIPPSPLAGPALLRAMAPAMIQRPALRLTRLTPTKVPMRVQVSLPRHL